MSLPGLPTALSNAAEEPTPLCTNKPTPCCADTLPTALSNAADTSPPLPTSKPIPSCAPPCANTTTTDTTFKEQARGRASCASIKAELAITKKKIAELEDDIRKLKNCPAAPAGIDMPGLSGVMEGQEKVLSGL